MRFTVPVKINSMSPAALITHFIVEARSAEAAVEAARDFVRLTGAEPQDYIEPKTPELIT